MEAIAPACPSTWSLVALDGRAAGGIAPVGHHTAQPVGLEEGGAGPIRFAQQLPRQGIVVGVALVAATAAVDVLLQPEGVDGQRGVAAVGGAAQHPLATGVLDCTYNCNRSVADETRSNES